MDNNKIQQSIIDAIGHELSLEDEFYFPQPMFCKVFFYPLLGIFLFHDAPLQYEVAYEMIKNNVLAYKGIVKHQGDDMVSYELISKNETTENDGQ